MESTSADMRTKLTAEEKQQVLDLRNQGKSYNEIARAIQFKVSPQRIAQICLMEELKVLRKAVK